MRKRRMHRHFEPGPVEDELLDRLVWAAGRAPHAGGALFRLLVVVTDEGLVRTVRQTAPGFFENDAPVVIAVCTNLVQAEAAGGISANDVARIDAGAAAENMALAAPALGLGVCFVTSFNGSTVREILELPAHVRPELLLAVGRPAPAASPAIKAPATPVHRDRYGSPWSVTA